VRGELKNYCYRSLEYRGEGLHCPVFYKYLVSPVSI
jgi:hypothetical protein